MYKINEKPIITPDMKLAELFEAYPDIVECFIGLLPIYNIKFNEKLFDSVIKITSIKQAAVVGKMELSELINKLRKIVGEEFDNNPSEQFNPEDYSIYIDYNAINDLQRGLHPAAKLLQELKDLPDKSVYILTTPFIPSPLIDKVQNEGFKTHVVNENSIIKTYIYK